MRAMNLLDIGAELVGPDGSQRNRELSRASQAWRQADLRNFRNAVANRLKCGLAGGREKSRAAGDIR